MRRPQFGMHDWTMEGITIQAASPDAARRMVTALSRSHPSCAADGCDVAVSLRGNRGELTAVLDALAEYVAAQETGPTRLRLAGRSYVMEGSSRWKGATCRT